MIIDWPEAVRPTRVELTLQDNAGTFVSPLTGTVKTQYRPGTHWRYTLNFEPVYTPQEQGLIDATLAALEGRRHRLRLPIWGQYRRGSAPDQAVAQSLVEQGGRTVFVTDLGPLALLAGDCISVNDRPYRVLQDMRDSRVAVSPPPRLSAPSTLRVHQPRGVFVLEDMVKTRYEKNRASLSVSLREDITL